MDNTLISRAVVQNEFRTAADLVDRVGGGAGPGGVKAVAPTGTESITDRRFPKASCQVSLLGEKLAVERIDGAGHLLAARPPDRRRQQRDARVPSRTAAQAGEAAGQEEVGIENQESRTGETMRVLLPLLFMLVPVMAFAQVKRTNPPTLSTPTGYTHIVEVTGPTRRSTSPARSPTTRTARSSAPAT